MTKHKHFELINEKLPALMPQLEKILQDNGLQDFSIGKLSLVHTNDDKCPSPCTGGKTCQLVVDPVTTVMSWKCV